MLFDDLYIAEIRDRLEDGDVDGIEDDLLDALDEIERLRAILALQCIPPDEF